jgi:prepilin signal peptidase PulO-like enzyme (type II secretory pathway)
VVIHRVPHSLWATSCDAECAVLAAQMRAPRRSGTAGVHIVTPRSACRSDQAPITALQKHPGGEAGWCCGAAAPSCQNPISKRYPLVELATWRALRFHRLAVSGFGLAAARRWRSPGS